MLEGTEEVNDHADLFLKLLVHYEQIFLDND